MRNAIVGGGGAAGRADCQPSGGAYVIEKEI